MTALELLGTRGPDSRCSLFYPPGDDVAAASDTTVGLL